MSNISQKLTYLNETKTKLKNVINYAGGNITNDTFRSYPEKLYDKFVDFVTNGTDSLYNSLPKVTGENTELTLNNTVNGVLKLDLKGNTSQASTSGKNKLNFGVSTETKNGILMKKNNSEITFDGTKENNSNIISIILGTFSAGNYTLSINKIDGTITNPSEEMAVLVNNQKKTGFSLNTNSVVKNLTLIEDGEIKINYWVNAGTIFSNAKYQFQLEQGSTATDYEPYTGSSPSPNPDYPQDIHVVTGDNDVKIENKNLAQYKNGYIIPTTGVFKSSNDDCFYFPVVQGETYYCQSTGNRTVGAIYTSIPVAEQTCIQGTNIPDVPKNGSFVASATGIMVVYANTPTSQSVIDTFIVTKGNTAPTSYTPHQEQNYRVSLGTLELCKIGTYEDYIYKDSGKWYVNKKTVLLEPNDLNIAIYGSGTDNYFYRLLFSNITAIDSSLSLCTHYKQTSITTSNTNQGFHNYANEIRVRYGIEQTPSDFKTWLTNNDVKFLLIRGTPINIEITDTTLISQLEALENAVSYEDQTNISQTNADLPFVISASAIKKYGEV